MDCLLMVLALLSFPFFFSFCFQFLAIYTNSFLSMHHFTWSLKSFGRSWEPRSSVSYVGLEDSALRHTVAIVLDLESEVQRGRVVEALKCTYCRIFGSFFDIFMEEMLRA